MSKWYVLPTALIVLFVATQARADWFASYNGHGAGSNVQAPAEFHGTKTYAAPHGYPFYSSCCEPRSSCAAHLWDGFCAAKRCWGHKSHSGASCGKGCATQKSCGKGCATQKS